VRKRVGLDTVFVDGIFVLFYFAFVFLEFPPLSFYH